MKWIVLGMFSLRDNSSSWWFFHLSFLCCLRSLCHSISSPCLARLQSVCCSESEAGVQMLQHVQQGNVEPSRKVTPPSRLAKVTLFSLLKDTYSRWIGSLLTKKPRIHEFSFTLWSYWSVKLHQHRGHWWETTLRKWKMCEQLFLRLDLQDRLALWPSQMISSCRGRRLHCMLQPPQKKAAEQVSRPLHLCVCGSESAEFLLKSHKQIWLIFPSGASADTWWPEKKLQGGLEEKQH